MLLSRSGNRAGLALTAMSCQKWCQNISKALGKHGSPAARCLMLGLRYADCAMSESLLRVAGYRILIQALWRWLPALYLDVNVRFVSLWASCWSPQMTCNPCKLLCDTSCAVRVWVSVCVCTRVCKCDDKCVHGVLWHSASLQPRVQQRVSQLLLTSLHLFTTHTEEVLSWWVCPLSSF